MKVTLTREEIIEACVEWLWSHHSVAPSTGAPEFMVWTGEGLNFGKEIPKDITLEFPEAMGQPYR